MTITYTARGFSKIDFTDHYDVACSLQKSSLATEDAIWLGCNHANPRKLIPGNGWHPVEMPAEYVADTRMHLTREQVARLLPILQHFVATGEVAAPASPAQAPAPVGDEREAISGMFEALASIDSLMQQTWEGSSCDTAMRRKITELAQSWLKYSDVIHASRKALSAPAQQVEAAQVPYGYHYKHSIDGDGMSWSFSTENPENYRAQGSYIEDIIPLYDRPTPAKAAQAPVKQDQATGDAGKEAV
jgi:hypothetical protein